MNNAKLPNKTMKQLLNDDLLETKIHLAYSVNRLTNVINELCCFDFELPEVSKNHKFFILKRQEQEYIAIELKEGVSIATNTQDSEGIHVLYLVIGKQFSNLSSLAELVNCDVVNNAIFERLCGAGFALSAVQAKEQLIKDYMNDIEDINNAYRNLPSSNKNW